MYLRLITHLAIHLQLGFLITLALSILFLVLASWIHLALFQSP